ncbi:epoxide hydrolase, soluble (sEH) [Mortierella sp. NVP85]|nr:epoxide hydrolase, soluble (sEH) [Mortierella sp. NVP85]
MNQVTKFDGTHEDLIHDVSFNYYGNRLATCSSDQKIKIWDYNESQSIWESNISFKASAHTATTLPLRLTTGARAFLSPSDLSLFPYALQYTHARALDFSNKSQLHRIIVFICILHGLYLGPLLCGFEDVMGTSGIWTDAGKKWIPVATLRDGGGTVQDVEFAPNHLGLRLAIVAADGQVKIYEAMDVTSLVHWALVDDFPVGNGGSKDEEGNHCLSWCTWKFASRPMMVVGCAKDHVAKIFRPDPNNKWQSCEVLGGHGGVVHDVSWAPNMGRSYHLIATACKDGHVRIYKLTDDTQGGAMSGVWSRKMFNVTCIADFPDHNAEVWRVEWNITGTILSSSGDDGKVRLWKATYTGDWKCMGVVSADEGPSAFQR